MSRDNTASEAVLSGLDASGSPVGFWQYLIEQCPVCDSTSISHLFNGQGTPLVGCDHCGLVMRNPQPSDEALDKIYSSAYFLGSEMPTLNSEMNALKRRTAELYLDQIDEFRRRHGMAGAGAALLDIGCGQGNLLLAARARGYQVSGVEVSASAVATANQELGESCVQHGTIEDVELPAESFDVCIMADVIEHTRHPAEFLDRVYRLVKPGGVIFIAVPSLDSWSARLMKCHWVEFKTEHLFYFDRNTLRNLFFRSGFGQVEVTPGRKILSPEYVYQHFQRFPVPIITPLLRFIRVLTPKFLLHRPLSLVASGVNVLARRSTSLPPSRRRQKLTVIMPVYNEKATFRQVMEALLRKQIEGIDIEIIVVDSNSTDGSRDDVLQFSNHPRVRVIIEDQTQGKGHAVRTGLARATGDIILIQDADLEYDLNDYEALLEPLRHFRKAFVLGSRHVDGRSWKVRRFEKQLHISFLMNFGHVFFTALFNLLYGQRLRDPFTMFKVFRRDCLHGMKLECNGFDFDCELIAKLVRRGYTPVEIPVNYKSRSFTEGKKVSFFRDPPKYLRAFVKYRFVRA